MKKKEYVCPELSVMRFTLRDVILTSPENISGNLNGDDPIDNPIIDPDPDDPINWD